MIPVGADQSTQAPCHSTDICDIAGQQEKQLASIRSIATYGRGEDAEMADKLPPVPEGGFRDEEGFEAWLKSLPEERIRATAQALTCRTALRSLPYLHFAFRGDSASQIDPRMLTLLALRATSMSRILLKFPSAGIFLAADQTLAATRQDHFSSTADNAAKSAARAIFRSALFATNSNLLLDDLSHSASISAAYFAASAFHPDKFSNETASFDAWQILSKDAIALTAGVKPVDLLATRLWRDDDPPEWWTEAKQRFQARLKILEKQAPRENANLNGWSIWIDWYHSLAWGRIPWKLPAELSWQIEKRIALGDGHFEAFWIRDLEDINMEILGWIEEEQTKRSNAKGSAFISYNENDRDSTVKIGAIIAEIGFDVFAQYKDMPPGSNFITEMNKGLDGMGKFVPVYSPDYVTSKACAAEWNAAFNMDRDGERRLIIGFMLRPATLPPLYRQIVHVPLYNLTEPQLRDAVRDALIWDGEKYGSARSREIAAEAALPAPTINMQGQIDVEASPLEAPFIDDDLARLPESMRRHIETLLEALEGSNCSRLLTRSLKNYLLELTAHGATPNLPDLLRAAELIENARLDAEDDGEGWCKRSSKIAFDQFAAMHEQLKQHFPLIMLRDISIDRTSIEPDRFDEEEFATAHKVLTEAANEAHQAGAMSDDYYAVMELREQQRRDIESLRAKPQPDPDTVFLHPADRKTSEDIKKRFLFDVSGSSDKLLTKTAQASQVADSEAIRGLVEAASDLLKSIWG